MSWLEFVTLWLGVFVTMLILGLAMVAKMQRHPHDYSDDNDDGGDGMSVDGAIDADDLDEYLTAQVETHGGRIETTDFGYRHIWADGTRKVYWETT